MKHADSLSLPAANSTNVNGLAAELIAAMSKLSLNQVDAFVARRAFPMVANWVYARAGYRGRPFKTNADAYAALLDWKGLSGIGLAGQAVVASAAKMACQPSDTVIMKGWKAPIDLEVADRHGRAFARIEVKCATGAPDAKQLSVQVSPSQMRPNATHDISILSFVGSRPQMLHVPAWAVHEHFEGTKNGSAARGTLNLAVSDDVVTSPTQHYSTSVEQYIRDLRKQFRYMR